MELKKILSGLDGIKAKGDLNIDIEKIENDSRKIENNSMFVAIKGFESDGHNYIETAIQKGAKAIMIQDLDKLKNIKIPDDVTIIATTDTRHGLAIASANYYQNPTKKMKVVGITGTKGKTTTSYMLKQVLEKAGKKVGLIGTIATYINGEKIKNNERTTPESIELQEIFAEMLNRGVEIVIMEVSSQALKLHRVDGVDFDIGVFTNFSEDHISEREHPNMEDYFNSKLKLFSMCKKGFINADDYNVAKVKKLATNCDIKTYGIDNSCDLLAKDVSTRNNSVDYRVKLNDKKNERVKVSIPGRYSVYNSLATICVAKELKIEPEIIKQALEEVKVPGRSELVPNKKNLNIMIDYAHSPESLESILNATKGYVSGNIILVFGCGGDRDARKRPIMGEIAGKLADYTIITSDNPRTEKPINIIKQIEDGMKKTKGKYICIENRREAIEYAIKIATKNDLIILAGKGHEPYQIIGDKINPFDERIIVNEIIG